MFWSAATDLGKSRERNEDAYDVFPLPEPVAGFVFVVADGLGGHQAGEVASGLAVRKLRENMHAWAASQTSIPSADTIGKALEEALLQANQALVQAAEEEPSHRGMATTLTVVWIDRGRRIYRYVHVGDSRFYLFRSGRLQQMTQDHGLVAQLLRSGELSPQQARHHPHRHVLTQALGLGEDLEVDSGDGELEAGDTVLLCTDGLTAVFSDQELEQWMAGETLDGFATRLIAAVNSRGGPDNVTVIAARMEENGTPLADHRVDDSAGGRSE